MLRRYSLPVYCSKFNLKIMNLRSLGIPNWRYQANERDLVRTSIIVSENLNYESRSEVIGTDKLFHGKYIKLVKKNQIG